MIRFGETRAIFSLVSAARPSVFIACRMASSRSSNPHCTCTSPSPSSNDSSSTYRNSVSVVPHICFRYSSLQCASSSLCSSFQFGNAPFRAMVQGVP